MIAPNDPRLSKAQREVELNPLLTISAQRLADATPLSRDEKIGFIQAVFGLLARSFLEGRDLEKQKHSRHCQCNVKGGRREQWAIRHWRIVEKFTVLRGGVSQASPTCAVECQVCKKRWRTQAKYLAKLKSQEPKEALTREASAPLHVTHDGKAAACGHD